MVLVRRKPFLVWSWIWLGLLVLPLLCVNFNQQGTSFSASLGDTPAVITPAADAPLAIDGNAQLAAAASAGNGTLGNPYLIKNRVIDATGWGKDAVFIRNTSAWFTLRNCIITKAVNWVGLRLSNVTHARIINNIIGGVGAGVGISLEHSDGNVLINSTVRYHGAGVNIEDSDDNILSNSNIVNNTNFNIALELSRNNTLIGLEVSNSGHGVCVWSSHNNTLINLTANNNKLEGFEFIASHNNTLTGNTVSFNTANGIWLQDADDNRLINNIANFNSQDGIILEQATRNLLVGNTANNNTVGGIGLFHANYTIIWGNTLWGNAVCWYQVGCEGNIFGNNDCDTDSEPIPGWMWVFLLMGLSVVILYFCRRVVRILTKTS